ncbi:MAG: elongation factor G [Candidatus Ratteibacteria bacterium]
MIEKVRNIGIIAHIDAGKTTTTERILYYTGKIYKIGNVDEGTAVMDWMDQEKERGITITSAATTCYWNGYRINIIDTPGHVDFTVEVERSLRVLDGAIGIFCAVAGVQPQSETVWRQSEKYNIPRIIYINKMDRIGADFFRVVEDIEKKLGSKVLILVLPIGKEDNFTGLIDIVEGKQIIYNSEFETEAEIKEIEEEYIEEFKNYRNILIEQLAEIDEEIMEKYLNEEEISTQILKKAIRKGTLSKKFFPAFCGSSLKNKGVLLLLDAICNYLPSPCDRGEIFGENPVTGKKEKRRPVVEEKFSGLVFKIYNDIHLGKILYTRIYSGKIKKGDRVLNSSRNRKEKILKILEIHANRYFNKEFAIAGDIVGIIGLKDTFTGDTLSDEDFPIIYESINFPEPVIYSAIEPVTKSDYQKLYDTLNKILEEDPTLQMKIDEETGQIILMGMGELHIDVVAERIKREYKIPVRLGKVEVAYRETITNTCEGVGEFLNTVGDKINYGYVVLKLEPGKKGEKFKFFNTVDKSKLPLEFVESVEEGVKESLEVGIYGFPIIDIKVFLVDAIFNPETSTSFGYKVASTIAFKNAYKNGNPCILQPIMRIEILTPEEFLGEVISDFNMRNGKVISIEVHGNIAIINGNVPLKNVFGYSTILRSLTQGRGSFIIEPLYYEVLNEEDFKKIVGIGIL